MSSTVRCSSCQVDFSGDQLENHISADHLDYYPYGCAYCGHWLPTEQLVHFHAQKKAHLPVKIRENPNINKERHLKEIIEASTTGGQTLPVENNDFVSFNQLWQTNHISNSASPASAQASCGSINSQSPPVATSTPQTNFGFTLTPSPVDIRESFQSFVHMRSFQLKPDSGRSSRSAANSDNSFDRDDKSIDVEVAIGNVGKSPTSIAKTSSQKQKKAKRNQELFEDDQVESNMTSGPIENGREKKLCNICQLQVQTCQMINHVNKHLATRPLAGCNYCNYKGRSLVSVRTHITWKHTGKSTKIGIGTRDLATVESTMEEMFECCFGKPKQQEICADPAAVSQNICMLRPYGKRAAKTTEFKPDSAKRQKPQFSPVETTSDSSGLVIGTSYSASGGRQYKHLICQVCNYECIDALASAHIYNTHTKTNMVHCPYCDFGVPYSLSDVKRHITTHHPNTPVDVIDKRQDPQMQELYKQWRTRCFPSIGQRRGGQTLTPNKKPVPMTVEEQVVNADKLLDQLFNKKPTSDFSLFPNKEWKTNGEIGLNSSETSQPKSANCTNDTSKINIYQKQPCLKCGSEVTLLWLHRHIWKHLSDDFGLSPFRCTVEGCEYSTYLRRSLDSHCNYHIAGSTTEQFGLIDERKKYTNEYMKCMVDCFGPNAHEVVSDSSFHELSTVNGSASVNGLEQNEAMVMQKQQSQVLDFNSYITAVPTDVWCQLCQCGFDGAEADEHVWQAHLGGVQPFRCGRCQKSFLELTQMEHHWRSEHNFHHTDEIEVIEYPEALSHFENTLVECFPDLAARRRTIKIEQTD